ncbi:hypothetical protein LR68_04241 [Anoxybacillus sp. BCO1]|nr:hypothetical protein LR68_04241 [Anoxybacillus sp. BCO1]
MEYKIETIPFELTLVGKGYHVKTKRSISNDSFTLAHARRMD